MALSESRPFLNGTYRRRIEGEDPREYVQPQTHRRHPCPVILLFQNRFYRAWETRRGDWRRLRHDRALVCFRADLRAPHFTNPSKRVALFRNFKEGQALRHERRVALLRDLCQRRPVDVTAERPGGVADEEQKVNKGTYSSELKKYVEIVPVFQVRVTLCCGVPRVLQPALFKSSPQQLC